jgi:hypothetical protein
MSRILDQQWSYSGNPNDSEKDAVRFLIGDTNSKDKQITDCEIEYYLQQEGSVLEAAICCVQGLIALYARDFDNELKTMSAQVTANYREMLKSLKQKRTNNIDLIYAGGLTCSDKNIDRKNPDMVQPMFTRHTGDNFRDGTDYT